MSSANHTQLRKAAPSDIDSLINIYIACHTVTYRNLIPEQNLSAYDQKFIDLQKDTSSLRDKLTSQINSGQIIIADLNSQPAGYAIIQPAENSIHISALFVHPQSSGNGIGSALIKQVISIAQTKNQTITLVVLINNLAAQSLYKKLGFTITSESSSEYYGVKKLEMQLAPAN